MGKKAIVLVSFGVSMPEVRQRSIDQLLAALTRSFPEYDTYLSFSSEKIRAKLARLELEVPPNLPELLEELHACAYEQIWIIPTHIIAGFEWEKLQVQLAEFAERFSLLELMTPLLATQDDCREFVRQLAQAYPIADDEILLCMGHGSEHPMNSMYAVLGYECLLQARFNLFIATVEGYPRLEDMLKLLQARPKPKCIHLVPLLFVAGDHAINDMAGKDDDSWTSILRSQGYEVKAHLVGLGELPFVYEMYLHKLRHRIQGCA